MIPIPANGDHHASQECQRISAKGFSTSENPSICPTSVLSLRALNLRYYEIVTCAARQTYIDFVETGNR
jgi:hypothetical protein